MSLILKKKQTACKYYLLSELTWRIGHVILLRNIRVDTFSFGSILFYLCYSPSYLVNIKPFFFNSKSEFFTQQIQPACWIAHTFMYTGSNSIVAFFFTF